MGQPFALIACRISPPAAGTFRWKCWSSLSSALVWQSQVQVVGSKPIKSAISARKLLAGLLASNRGRLKRSANHTSGGVQGFAPSSRVHTAAICQLGTATQVTTDSVNGAPPEVIVTLFISGAVLQCHKARHEFDAECEIKQGRCATARSRNIRGRSALMMRKRPRAIRASVESTAGRHNKGSVVRSRGIPFWRARYQGWRIRLKCEAHTKSGWYNERHIGSVAVASPS